MEIDSNVYFWFLGIMVALAPLAYLAAAVVANGRPFWWARLATRAGVVAALGTTAGWVAAGGAPIMLRPTWLGPRFGSIAPSIRLDVVTVVMMVLVSLVGWVIVRFSKAYLAGETRLNHFVRWLMATITAVWVLVLSNNLLWLSAGWVATSLALHQLLTFYRERPQAIIAAHKKFVVSRVADLCVLAGIAVVGAAAGSLELDRVHAWATEAAALPWTVQFAAVLFVVGASLKCAQLPFHGWLIQVMEAPTPVSALLHAGVVNIGGFLMIRLMPLMAKAEFAQVLLVAIGCSTVVLAALVMTTRPSIKEGLAWSTSAQMGFMLVQCSLGAYSLALLHLVAHSLYKAHAFLSSGSTVEIWRTKALSRPKRTSLGSWLAAAVVSLCTVVCVGSAFGVDPDREPALWTFAAVLSFALVPLLVHSRKTFGRVAALVVGAGVVSLYIGWHNLFGHAMAANAALGDTIWLRAGFATACFVALFATQALIAAHPQGRFAQSIYPALLARLYLDEWFTRITFRLWPAKIPAQPAISTQTREA